LRLIYHIFVIGAKIDNDSISRVWSLWYGWL